MASTTGPFGLNDESVEPEDSVRYLRSGQHHHHDPREVCVEVATVPQNPEKSLTSQTPTPLEPHHGWSHGPIA